MPDPEEEEELSQSEGRTTTEYVDERNPAIFQPMLKKPAPRKKTPLKKKNRSFTLTTQQELQLVDDLRKIPALRSSGSDYPHYGKEEKALMWEALGTDLNLSGKYFQIIYFSLNCSKYVGQSFNYKISLSHMDSTLSWMWISFTSVSLQVIWTMF